MKKLLIIEDDPDLRNIISEFFHENDFKVISSPDGINGIKLAKENKPDVIICDLHLPGIDGFKVKEILAEDKNTYAIPFIYLTGNKEINDIRHAMELGADDYIIKPVKVRDLLNLVLKRLERINSFKSAKQSNLKDHDGKFIIKNGKQSLFVSFNDIKIISAEGYYTVVHLNNGKKITIKKSLKNWLTILPNNKFYQVHRNSIINIEMIEKLESGPNGNYIAKLKNYPELIFFSQRCSQKIRKDSILK